MVSDRARAVSDSKPQLVLDKPLAQAKRITDVRIAALGLAFEPNIDDPRESPARQIVNQLSDDLPEATIMEVEPNIDQLPSDLTARENATLTELNDAVKEADIVPLVVHNEFARIDRSLLAQKIVHDTRGVWN